MREEFETWFWKKFPDAARIPPGPWLAYQAGALAMRERAAKVCDSVNNYDNPMTASDCSDAIRQLPVEE